jgi:thiosulfate dehydrogenase
MPATFLGSVSMALVAGVFAAAAGFAAQSALAQARGSPTAAVNPDIWAVARGGQLYDDWMAVLDAEPPKGNHPAYPAVGKRKGRTTWRCKECHGWDYMGEDGAYRRGSHTTGIKGVRRVVGMDPAEIEKIITDKTHGYTPDMIPPRALRKLAMFLSRGQVAMDQYIDRETEEARGDLRRGASFFQTVCAICHGFDGSQIFQQTN